MGSTQGRRRQKTTGSTVQTEKWIAAYCRVSTASGEQLNSYYNQIRHYRELGENEDQLPVEIYADEGITGVNTGKRDAFNRMLEDCRKGKIARILTKSVSRFGRNTLDCLRVVRELKALRIDVYFEKENLHTKDVNSEVLLTLLAAMAQTESGNQSENVRWGIERKYEKGSVSSLPGNKYYGYRKDGRRGLIAEACEAEVVRRIYQEYLDGYGACAIARHLTEEGVPTRLGLENWSWSTVGEILTNEKYKGDTLFRKSYVEDFMTKKRVKNHGQLSRYYAEDTHEAIMEREIWEAVRQERERRQANSEAQGLLSRDSAEEQYPFSGKIICGVCGKTYRLYESRKKDEPGRKYWRCQSFLGKKGTPIMGKRYTPKPRVLRKEKVVGKRRRILPQERQMLCTDIQVDDIRGREAFVEGWNELVDRGVTVTEDGGGTELERYRARDLSEQIERVGRIEQAEEWLVRRTLEQIVIGVEGVRVRWLAGRRYLH